MIKEARIKLGMSQEELARKLGITKNAISNYENGIRVPKWSIALQLSRILKIPLEKIVTDERKEE